MKLPRPHSVHLVGREEVEDEVQDEEHVHGLAHDLRDRRAVPQMRLAVLGVSELCVVHGVSRGHREASAVNLECELQRERDAHVSENRACSEVPDLRRAAVSAEYAVSGYPLRTLRKSEL